MAISETTKLLIHQERRRLDTQLRKNIASAEALELQVAGLRKANIELEKNIAALKKDIPEPKPAASSD